MPQHKVKDVSLPVSELSRTEHCWLCVGEKAKEKDFANNRSWGAAGSPTPRV